MHQNSTEEGEGHIDFPETADIESSSDEYASRFSGPVGRWMLKVQETITLKLMEPFKGGTILDVGGGHGQLAVPLSKSGYKVTVLGSAANCAERIREVVDLGNCEFVVGNVIELPFDDNSFDVAISFRMVTHCSRWPQLVSELCRVARKAVIVDYPTSQSLNKCASLLFDSKKKFEKNTRVWTLFRHADIRDVFVENGFPRRKRKVQFFLPMVCHRILGCKPISAATETLFRAIGLTGLLGSPVILRMQPPKNGEKSSSSA